MEKKVRLKDFPFNFWTAITFEFFERGSYYGVMSFLSVYMITTLGFSRESVGSMKSVVTSLLYFLPILTGAIADRLGYRKTLLTAFSLLGLGYFLMSQATEYFYFFAAYVIMAIGGGAFKPVISGTIAKLTDERTSSIGFGIFYWSINLGAFLFPLLLVPFLRNFNDTYVMIAAAIFTAAMILPTLFIYKEPKRDEPLEKSSLTDSIKAIFMKIALVIKDWRFILFIFIYSWFWIIYFQMFDSVLWYFKEFVDPAPFNAAISGILGFEFNFDVEHITVVNAAAIIILQVIVSLLVRRTKPLPTIVTGVGFGVLGMVILSLSTNIWVFILGIFVFTIGEMTAHPKYISYLGLIAPQDKKATYMGFGFLYGVFGSFIAGLLGAYLYVALIDKPVGSFVSGQLLAKGSSVVIKSGAKLEEVVKTGETIGLTKADIVSHANISEFWLIFAGIGVMSIIALLLYEKFIGTRDTNKNI